MEQIETSFKHLTKEHCDAFFATGEIFIGNYKLYKDIENPDIVDPTEGYKTITWGGDQPSTMTVRDGITGELISPSHENYGLLTMETFFTRKIHYPDAYIYCTSASSEEGLFSGYESCFEIIDPKFYSYIARYLLQKGLMKRSMDRYLITYFQDRMVDEKNNIPAYFVKDKSFEREMEARVVFTTKCTTKEEILKPIITFIPELISCCRRIR